jgi:hypothetical protein
MSDVADVLERAAALIEPEGAWTQGVLGRDANGRILMARDLGRAVCFCAQGAIIRVSDASLAWHAVQAVQKIIRSEGLGYWNDRPGRTQKQVVAKLREAAKLAREKRDA